MAKKQAQRLMPLYLLEYSEKLFENHPDPEAPWGGGGGSPIEAGTGIDITGDETKTISIDETVVATKTDLEDYVTGTSLTATLTPYAKINDSTQELVSKSFTGEYVTVTPGGGYIRTTYGPNTIGISIPRTPGYTLTIPHKDGTLAVTDDIPDVSEFVTETTLTATLADYELKSEAFSGDYNDLTNKPDLSIYAESADLATVATSGSYNDLIDKPTIPSIPVTDVEVNGVSVLSGTVAEVTVPTDTSDLTNSAGFITSSAIPTNVSSFTNDANYVTSASLTAELANYVPSSSITTVAYTGSYNDLTDTPTIGHGVLTIQVNGTNVKQFSANETAAKTANILVPTKTSDLTNDSGFITSSDIPSNLCKYIDLGSGSYNPVITQTVLDTIATSPKDYVLLYNYTYQGATYCIKFQYMNTVSGSYFYQSYNVGKVVNNTLTECSMVFTMAIRISDGTPTMTSGDTTPTAGTGIRITGHEISVNSLTVAMKSDLTGLVPASSLSTVAFSGSYTDLSDKPNIPVSTSDLNNDSGYITKSVNNLDNYTLTSNLAAVATSGSYNDLTNKPTIPDAVSGTNDGTNWTTLTIGSDTYDIPQGGSTPGMIGEVIYDNKELNVASITLSNSIDDYSFIDVQYTCSDYINHTTDKMLNTLRIYKSGNSFVNTIFQTPSMGYVQQNSWYSKNGEYKIASTTSISVNSQQWQISYLPNNNPKVLPEWQSTSTQAWIIITKVIGYKANSSALTSGKKYKHHLSLFNNATVSSATLRVTATIETNSPTPFTVDTLKSWLYDNNYRTVANGIYEASGTYYESSISYAVLGIRCYEINSGTTVVVPKAANVYLTPQITYVVDVVDEDDVLITVPTVPTYTTLFSATPTAGTTVYSIELSDSVANYDEIIIYYYRHNSTVTKSSLRLDSPSVGDLFYLITYETTTNPRLYTKADQFTITDATHIDLVNAIQQRIGNNESTNVDLTTTEMRCKPYKVVGIKY